MYCPNPDCPHAQRTGEPAEYREDIAECQDCGSTLAEARPESPSVAYERFVPVFEISSAGLLPFVESLIRSSGMRFFVKGIGSGLDFVSGPVKVYVEPDRADEARELLAEVSAAPENDGPVLVDEDIESSS